jgi:hypothetical protein
MQKSCQPASRTVLLGLLLLCALRGPAFGQTLVPQPNSIFPTPSDLNRRHMDPTGKPCLKIGGYTKPELINPDIFEHMVGVTNSCGQNIKLKVCYYKTQDCIDVNAPPWGSKESVLGIYPALKDFRFEAKEQF